MSKTVTIFRIAKSIFFLAVFVSIFLSGAANIDNVAFASGVKGSDSVPGDMNGDGQVKIDDAVVSLKLLAGVKPSTLGSPWGDVDGDGKVSNVETAYILKNISGDSIAGESSYMVVDTGQTTCYNSSGSEIACPAQGQDFYGQDAQVSGMQPSYRDNGNGTINDLNTGLMWLQSPDLNNDGDIDADDKLTYSQAMTQADTFSFAGYNDWRVPTIKELYSLIDFRGIDPSGYEGADTSWLIPFIDTDYFEFGYGDTSAGERIIDAQFASSTLYVSGTGPGNLSTMFGVNFADGRIKGYGLIGISGSEKTFYVLFVRGDSYGKNNFQNNNDGTITDYATELMWAQNDNGSGLDWEEALAWVQTKNSENYLGYSDWRLPNIKELQSIVDYTRSPDTTASPALDPMFNATQIINEAGEADYAYYWSGTTHANWTQKPGPNASYVAFGRAMGYMNEWIDVHGAGAQRSDPKAGDPDDYPYGHGPQGDAIRIYNFVRLVRNPT